MSFVILALTMYFPKDQFGIAPKVNALIENVAAGDNKDRDLANRNNRADHEKGGQPIAPRKGGSNVIGSLFGSKQPAVKAMKVFPSQRVKGRFIYGYDLMITIENPTSQAIENVQCVLQNRTEGRTVANTKHVIGGHIPGGIEKNAVESFNIFEMNEYIGLESDYRDKLPKGDFLEIAIQKVEYANGETLDLGKSLSFVRGVETEPDEEHIMNQRRKTLEWKFREGLQEFLEKELPRN